MPKNTEPGTNTEEIRIGSKPIEGGNFPFRLEIDRKIAGRFSEVTMTGKAAQGVRGTVTLKRGVFDPQRLFHEWLLQAGKNKGSARKNVAIVMTNDRGQDAVRWRLSSAWPSKYNPPDFNAKGNDVAVETIVIVHEGIERVDDP